MRSLVIVILLTFGLYAKSILIKQHTSAKKLESYKNSLEKREKKLKISNDILSKEIAERKKIQKELEYLSTTDTLTNLYNRRKFNETLKYEISKIKRYPGNLSLIVCDVDHFKQINDNYGHDVGDEVLISFSKILKSSLRESDVVARWGGEEFVILLTNETPEDTFNIIEKLRNQIKSHKFDKIETLTASFGISFFKENDNENNLLKRADRALYLAKGKGRDCTLVII